MIPQHALYELLGTLVGADQLRSDEQLRQYVLHADGGQVGCPTFQLDAQDFATLARIAAGEVWEGQGAESELHPRPQPRTAYASAPAEALDDLPSGTPAHEGVVLRYCGAGVDGDRWQPGRRTARYEVELPGQAVMESGQRIVVYTPPSHWPLQVVHTPPEVVEAIVAGVAHSPGDTTSTLTVVVEGDARSLDGATVRLPVKR